jgi:hypothetical protein
VYYLFLSKFIPYLFWTIAYITSHPSDKVVTVLAETSSTATNKANATLTTKNGIYLVLLAISGPTQSLFGRFLRRTIATHHACAQNLLYLVQSRDTETRAFVLRLFLSLEDTGAGEMQEQEDAVQGLGEKFWRAERLSFIVSSLKDSRILCFIYFSYFAFLLFYFWQYSDISTLSLELLKLLCESYPSVPHLALGLLWQGLLDAQFFSASTNNYDPHPQTLVLALEWVLARFPEHVGGVVGKIGSALFLPASFQASSGAQLNTAHYSYLYSIFTHPSPHQFGRSGAPGTKCASELGGRGSSPIGCLGVFWQQKNEP